MGWPNLSDEERKQRQREQYYQRRDAGLIRPLTTKQSREKAQRMRARNRERYRARQRGKRAKKAEWVALLVRLNVHKITLDQFHAKYESQDFRCAICGHDMDGYREQHIDHCHTTGKFRGLLCNNCNNGLGHFKDNPARLVSAAQYLERNAR